MTVPPPRRPILQEQQSSSSLSSTSSIDYQQDLSPPGASSRKEFPPSLARMESLDSVLLRTKSQPNKQTEIPVKKKAWYRQGMGDSLALLLATSSSSLTVDDEEEGSSSSGIMTDLPIPIIKRNSQHHRQTPSFGRQGSGRSVTFATPQDRWGA